MERKSIENKVEMLLSEYGYCPESDSYVDIIAFAQKHGFIVGNARLPESEDGFLAIRSVLSKDNKTMNIQRIIGVNADRTLDWKRFIIAHELGHSVLHPKQEIAYLHREHRTGKDKDENDADYFAAALLMPQKSFQRVYSQLESYGIEKNELHSRLASEFGVPPESAKRRIHEVIG